MTGGLVWLAMSLAVGAAAPDDEVPDKPLTGVVKTIDGKDVALETYVGKVVLVVNVASRCGFTRQYRPLQELHEKYAEQGLAENPHRPGSWGRYEGGKFREVIRFDKAKPGAPGYEGKDHIHIDGGDKHLPPDTPIPGEVP